MRAIRHLAIVFAEDAIPRGTILRARLRISIDTLLTAGTAALAVALAIGYQVLRLRHLGDRSARS